MARKIVLQEFLPYLLNRAGLRIGVMFSREIEPMDVTLPMWRVLVDLWRNGDHRLGELAERTTIDISTLSRLLVTMQRRQLITRRRSGSDGRALSLTLTAKGLDLITTIMPIAVGLEEIATRGMSASDVKRLRTLLKKAFQNLDAASQEAEASRQTGRATAKKRAAPKAAKRRRTPARETGRSSKTPPRRRKLARRAAKS